jgi:single-stranded-DNA-specific exonuclease
VEEFGRPTVLIALEGNEGKGSGRSTSRFHLHGGLAECRDLLLRFGGHAAAAGVTIAREQVRSFAERFNDVARSRLTPDDLIPELRVDLEVALEDCTLDLESLLRHLEPCGAGNPSPVLVTRGARVASPPQIVGQGGLKLRLASDNGGAITAIGWGMGARSAELHPGALLDVAFRLERDDWNGETRLQGRLADFRVLGSEPGLSRP